MTARARQSRSEPREMILIEHLPFETDAGIGERARIGLIVLASDFTIEHEWRAIFAALPGVALYESRLFNDPIITPEIAAGDGAPDRPRSQSHSPRHPLDRSPSAAPRPRWRSARRGCSTRSAPAAGSPGDDAGHRRLCGVPALGAKRIAVLTPYRAEVNPIVADYIDGARLRGAGVRLVQRGAMTVSSRPSPRHRSRPASGDPDGRRRRCGVRLLHLGATGRGGGRDRGGGRPAGHLVESCDGLACTAACRHSGWPAAIRKAVHTSNRLMQSTRLGPIPAFVNL